MQLAPEWAWFSGLAVLRQTEAPHPGSLPSAPMTGQGLWAPAPCLAWSSMTEGADIICHPRGPSPQSPCSVFVLCAGSGSKYLKWGFGEEEPERERDQCPNGALGGVGGQRMLAGSLGGRLQDQRGFSSGGSPGLSPNAGQPLSCSSVLPADGSVCMRTTVKTAPGIT